MATVTGTTGNDFIHRAGDGQIVPPGFNEVAATTTADDLILGDAGDDIVYGDAGNDTALFNAATDGADLTNLGEGRDTVNLLDGDGQIRLTFTSSEVGNGNAADGSATAPQDGGLAVRLQREDDAGNLTGLQSRFDDEGITFTASGGTTFDVRDLVSGAQRGDGFRTATLGTMMADSLAGTRGADYVNAGQGDDAVMGNAGNDFLVGGAGADRLNGGTGDDSFIGGGGSDRIVGASSNTDGGVDTYIANVTTDGADSVLLGGGMDVALINAAAPTNVRLTFTSAEVGNGSSFDGSALANQDGGLAARLQAEGADGVPLADTTRLDDEGVTFVAGTGVTFDVRDLVSGAQRGEAFEVVTLGTRSGETLSATQAARPYYINGGAGDDTVFGSSGADFLVGGAGNDALAGSLGADGFIGGGGDDRMTGGAGNDAYTGGDGADTFVFAGLLNASTNVDTIGDFAAEDTIALSGSIFRDLQEGALDASRFKEIAFYTQTQGVDADDRILYDKDDGDLYFDRDGIATQYQRVKFAEVADNTALTSNDFLIV